MTKKFPREPFSFENFFTKGASPEMRMLRAGDFSDALEALNSGYIQSYMDEGHDPNQRMVLGSDLETLKDISSVSLDHPLVFLLRRQLEDEGFQHLNEAFDDLYKCGRALLSNNDLDHSRIEYLPDHFGFSPADYAVCSEHTELATEVILDKLTQDCAHSRYVIPPDMYLLSLLHTKLGDEEAMRYYQQNARDVVNAIQEELEDHYLVEKLFPQLTDSCERDRHAEYFALARKVWEQPLYELDELVGGYQGTKVERELGKFRGSYNACEGDFNKHARKFIKLFNVLRQELTSPATPRPFS